ncbi:MAG: peptide chain release factor N(5)-glutamine methyltransferase [Pseudomonadota bacterium]
MKTSSVRPPEKTGPAWTILNLLKWAVSYFASRDVEQARASAEILLAHALGLKRIDLYLRYDQPLHPEELARFKTYIKRRVNSEPVAYITGEKEFWSMPFTVTPDVLIPRPDTECLVETALALIPATDNIPSMRVLELGTGSGAIAVALASERRSARIFASDRSGPAIRIAQKNAGRHGLANKIHFFCSDWFLSIRSGVFFDMIVSNPPYIRRDGISGLQPEIVRYEPHDALDGGAHGVDALEAIICRSKAYLVPKGYLLLEIGYDQKASVVEIAQNAGGYEPVRFFRDYGGLDRVAQLRRMT